MISLAGKNIIVSGASSGIGKACAVLCNHLGASVHLVGRNKQNLSEVYNSLQDTGNSYHILDMHDTDKFQPFITGLVSEFGKITGFIHSAGYQISAPLKAMQAEMYKDIFMVNSISAFELSMLITSKKNHVKEDLSILFIAGGISVIGVAALTAYAASKAALVGAARAMAVELAPKRIRANCISPGYVTDTNMFGNLDSVFTDAQLAGLGKDYPLGLGKTSDIAPLCAFLMSDQARWITGQNLLIDGGVTAR